MESNLTEMLLGWFSTLFLIFVTFRNSAWLLGQLCFLIGWNMSFSEICMCYGIVIWPSSLCVCGS